MADDPSATELFTRWQELCRQGEHAAAEALCAGRPELAAEWRRRAEAVKVVEAFLATPRAADREAATIPPPAGAGPLSPTPQGDLAHEPTVAGYELLGELGRGGMGVVYLARQTGLGRLVALKMALSGGHAAPGEMARFRAEAESAARLQHPNIVQVHEVGETAGGPYFSLEYCPGGSLTRALDGKPWDPRKAAALVKTLAGAVHAAHQASVVHRDLKPANVLLAADGSPKIADFGLAKRLDGPGGHTATGAVLGTPGYMAPEQAEGKTSAVGPAADVYALGAILYELLTGRPPFRGNTPLETVLQVLADDPVPPGRLAPGLPRDLETVCLKCLQKRPADRYPSAAALADDLERYLSGEPITARSTGLMDRIALALERSQFDVQFRSYGNLLFAFAAVVALTELVIFLIIHTGRSVLLIPVAQAIRLLIMALLLRRCRPGTLLPANVAERTMWSLWIGYLTACGVMGLTYRLVAGPAVELEVNLYPGFAAATGMAFLVLGSSYWGRCYAFGLAFYGLAFVMTLDMRWAPIEFGLLWAAVFILIGLRLHRLAGGSPRD